MKVVEAEPNNSAAHAGLGVAFAEQNDHESAINQYKTALRLEPQARRRQLPDGSFTKPVEAVRRRHRILSQKRNRTATMRELENALADAYQAKGLTQQAQEARNKAAQLGDGQKD